MNHRRRITFFVIVVVASSSCNRDAQPVKRAGAMDEKVMWPPLPAKGFIAGRAATKEDLAKGDAAFFLGVSEPIKLEIPQYAYHLDGKTGKRVAGIIIQAERTPDGKELVAMQPVEGGGPLVALLAEYKLLGKLTPKEE